ncbi:EscU/YscU/HrcU family type III secretion system export apparatus switch protein [Robertmurraya sp. DFI.2.37]|uniref:EscU/YscU/HrcU family type III secretion system export apparatus switch protein n=1 Tax=Robertmurraya sp. DFI.2.37 TaxID=3031819 RepID=UPI001246BC47|nr:EscU/YscU/HrcU family type III secretion system export apparatus switch protein [Robertmurraya sp. DFI.2.37]MDF1506603.1 EscU/YscU/HrcU family type III secretion system export apparatus switch protein [Robertmurraya sp. DFI.2.37]
MKNEELERRKEAIALGYESGTKDAPRVIAKGKGIIAENILEQAAKHEVPIQEDAALVELLSKLNINETIPEELYQAVAEVFAFIYKTNREAGRKGSSADHSAVKNQK